MDRLLEVRGLDVVYHTQTGKLKALHDVEFDVRPGEIVGIVGESGCGKSTVASTLLRLLPPNGEITHGQIIFGERDVAKMGQEELREMRGREMAMIFQDPMTSLNPVFNIETQMTDVEQAHAHQPAASAELRHKLVEALTLVGIPDADERVRNFPHQFSGGMRQRIMIAMALMSRPSLLIADEPTSALDVTLEAQILELIKRLRREQQTAIVFITHDLGVVAQLCERVIVMYAGRIVEQGEVVSIFESPQHPYTRALLASVPSRKNYAERLATIPGRVPSLSTLPPGCKFADRCPLVQAVCNEHEPRYLKTGQHDVRCHVYDPQSGYVKQPETPAPAQKASSNSLEVRVLREAPLWGADALRGNREDAVEERLRTLSPVETAAVAGPSRPESHTHNPNAPLVTLKNISTFFYDHLNLAQRLWQRQRGAVRAVDGVSLDVRQGEVIGLVGESGSGKTTLGKVILRLAPLTGGQINFAGQDMSRASADELRRLRGRMQMIFQDPYSSLSPRLRVSYLLTEPYKIHHLPPDKQYTVSQLLEMVGLSDEQALKFPHELSGGQARRVGIARALALRPEFLVADEPTSGLDVSVAASILNLMKDLAQQLGLTYLIITHNLNVVGYISDRIAVMYLGKLVEMGDTAQIFESPTHPYTLALLSSISEPDPRQRKSARRLLLADEIPSPKNPPPGCRFHTRCPFAEARCKTDTPPLEEVEPGHHVACHFWERVRESQVSPMRVS